MKTKHIIAILIIGICIVIVMTMAGDASSYVDFKQAKYLSENGSKSSIHVVGTLPRTSSGDILGIEESPDMLSFKFDMVDENGFKQKVLHANPMPTDFTKSEQVVIVGSYQGENFIAEKILLKCPSKYEEDPEFTS